MIWLLQHHKIITEILLDESFFKYDSSNKFPISKFSHMVVQISGSDYPSRNDPEYERTEFSEKVERRELYLQGGWLA